MHNRNPLVDRYRILCLLILACFAFLLSLQRVYNYDIWWHLRVGEYILEHFVIPTRDFLSFSTEGASWVNLYWLSDPLFALVHETLGMNGLLFLKSMVIALSAVFLGLLIMRGGLSPFWASLLVIFVLEISRFRFMLRPLFFQFAGMVFLLWFLYRMQRFRYKEVLLFGVIIIWNGLHGSAFVVQVVLAMLVAEKLIDRWANSPRYQPGQLRKALVLLLLSFAALLLNPNGFALYEMVYGHLFSDVVTGSYVSVEEHQALVLTENLPFVLLLVGAAASFLVRRENFRPLTLLLYLAFAVLAFGSTRYVALAAFVMAAVIGLNLQGEMRWDPFREDRPPWLGAVCLLLLVSLCAGILLWTFRSGRVYEFGWGINQSRYPYAAVEKLEELDFSGNIYNSWRFGGFLQWMLPESRTFIDGRCLPEQLQLYDRFAQIALRDFAQYMADNAVQAALIDRRNQRDISYFNELPGYRVMHMDDLSVLFVKSELLTAQERTTPGRYTYLRLGGYEYQYLAPLANSPEAPLVESELLAALRASPENFFVNFLLAFFYDARGDTRAAEQYMLAASKNPRFAHTHFEIGKRAGRAALKAGNWELAAEVTREALAYQKTGELYFLLGAAEQQRGRLQEAEEAYRESLELQENPQVMNNLGFLLLERADYRDAKDVFSRLAETAEPRYEEAALYGMALASIGQGETERASDFREELGRKYPESSYLPALQKRLAQ